MAFRSGCGFQGVGVAFKIGRHNQGVGVACREWLCIAHLQQDRDRAYRELQKEDKLLNKTLEATLVSRIEGLSFWPQIFCILPMSDVNLKEFSVHH